MTRYGDEFAKMQAEIKAERRKIREILISADQDFTAVSLNDFLDGNSLIL